MNVIHLYTKLETVGVVASWNVLLARVSSSGVLDVTGQMSRELLRAREVRREPSSRDLMHDLWHAYRRRRVWKFPRNFSRMCARCSPDA